MNPGCHRRPLAHVDLDITAGLTRALRARPLHFVER
jgi:hypothetical protein